MPEVRWCFIVIVLNRLTNVVAVKRTLSYLICRKEIVYMCVTRAVSLSLTGCILHRK